MVIGLLFTTVLSVNISTPTGFSYRDFETIDECKSYYKSLSGFELKAISTNFYTSADQIMAFETPWGFAWATCKVAK